MWSKLSFLPLPLLAIILIVAPAKKALAQQEWYSSTDTSPELVILVAAATNDTSALKLVLQSGVDTEIYSSTGFTPLGYAVMNNHTEAAKLLLEFGADPNMASYFGETPLITAVRNASLTLAELLIRAGASVNKSDVNGATPLHYAALSGHYYEADMLIYYDAVTDFRSLDGTTPLMAAVMSGSYDIADILIREGADVNSTDDLGYSPLLLAAQNGDTLMAELLLLSGADLYRVASDGYNAPAIAVRDGFPLFFRYIMAKGKLWSDTEAINPWNVADQYRRRDFLPILSTTGIKHPPASSLTCLSGEIGWMQTSWQSFATLSLKMRRNIRGTGISAGIMMKPHPSRVIIEADDGILYQFRDKRAVITAGVFREFIIGRNNAGALWIASLSARAGYKFGNAYPGSTLKPESGLTLMPGLAIQYETSMLTYALGAEYMRTEVYRSGPVWIKAGVSFNYCPVNVKSKGKTIRWF